MCRSHKVTQAECIAFNVWRQQNTGRKFNQPELIEELTHVLGFPIYWDTISEMSKGVNPPIIKHGNTRDARFFVNPKPVFIGRLQTAFNKTVTKEESKLSKEEETLQKMIEVNPFFAISVLKKMGFRVQRIEYTDLQFIIVIVKVNKCDLFPTVCEDSWDFC